MGEQIDLILGTGIKVSLNFSKIRAFPRDLTPSSCSPQSV